MGVCGVGKDVVQALPHTLEKLARAIKIKYTHWPNFNSVSSYSTYTAASMFQELFTRILTAALLVMAKDWKIANVFSKGNWLNTLLYSHLQWFKKSVRLLWINMVNLKWCGKKPQQNNVFCVICDLYVKKYNG